MKLKDLTKEELEAMSYDDIAMMILTETAKKYKINELFKEVCNLLNLTDDEYMAKLPAFFDVLSTDHRFIMLENGLWDLKTKHKAQIVMDNLDDDEEEIIDEEITDEPEEEKDDNIYADDDDVDDLTDDDDDLKDLVIIDDDEEANGLS